MIKILFLSLLLVSVSSFSNELKCKGVECESVVQFNLVCIHGFLKDKLDVQTTTILKVDLSSSPTLNISNTDSLPLLTGNYMLAKPTQIFRAIERTDQGVRAVHGGYFSFNDSKLSFWSGMGFWHALFTLDRYSGELDIEFWNSSGGYDPKWLFIKRYKGNCSKSSEKLF